MSLRPLVLDDYAREEAARVVSYAMDHIYRPRAGAAPPGDDPGHVAQLNTYRVVFSITEADGLKFRHLSVSVPGGKFPHAAAVFSIADLFGFTGWDQRTINRAPPGWVLGLPDNQRCVVLAQKVGT